MPHFNGLYSGLHYSSQRLVDGQSSSGMDLTIQNAIQSNGPESIVAVTMYPESFVINAENIQDPNYNTSIPAYNHYRAVRPTHLGGTSSTGYAPNNKKLLTFPYLMLNVDCLNDNHVYRFERFTNPLNCQIKVYMIISPNPEMYIVPENYDGMTENCTESLSMNGFPQCACIIDSYRAWLAQKATGQAIGLVGQIGGAIAGLAAAPATGGASLGVTFGSAVGLAQSVNTMVHDATQGTRARGTQGAAADVATRNKKIYFKVQSITREYAEKIDGFLDKFGYAQNTFAVPNLTARPHWTYIKTAECNAKSVTAGGVPADTLKQIKAIFNKGITFWRNLSEVGDYVNNDNRVPV